MAMTFGGGGGQGRRVAFVGFESALEFWRGDSNLGCYEDCFDPDGKLQRVQAADLSGAAWSERDLGELGVGLCAERPLDLLVPPGAKGYSPLVSLHRIGWGIPPMSFVQARRGVLVAVPELVFLEAAASFSPVELLKLGMELCGTYAPDRYSPYGSSDRRRICSVASIRRYLARCPQVPGIVKARDAAEELMDNSHSIFESKVMLGLTLPARKRGLGLRKPTLNDRQDATKLQAETIGEHTYFFDASWRGTLRNGTRYAVDCEVDSNPHFRDEAKVRSDAERRDNVQYLGATHISITSEDFKDVNRFVKKGLMIAHHIGQRIRRYPRRGSEEQQAAYLASWQARVDSLDDLLRELACDAHPPRSRPKRGWPTDAN